MKRRTVPPLPFEDQQTITVPCPIGAGWDELVASVTAPPGRPAGEGWLTVSELSAKLNKCRPTVEEMVNRWKRNGAIETAYGTNTRNQRVIFVRPKAAAKLASTAK